MLKALFVFLFLFCQESQAGPYQIEDVDANTVK